MLLCFKLAMDLYNKINFLVTCQDQFCSIVIQEKTS